MSLTPEPGGSQDGGSSQAPTPEPVEHGFSSKRLIDKLLSTAAQHMHEIERQGPADPPPPMLSNIGQIQLHPDPTTVLIHGTGTTDGTQESAPGGSRRRPGLLSQYLRLIHADRRNNNKGRVSGATTPVNTKREVVSGEWIDDMAMSTAASRRTSSSGGLRRRRRQGQQQQQQQGQRVRSSWRLFQSRSNTPTPSGDMGGEGQQANGGGFFASGGNNRTTSRNQQRYSVVSPLANTPGVPFRHLSEALPWASSQRQHQAALSACGTPLALTRRPSVSSVTGDITTMRPTTKVGAIEQQNIEHAISLLLLHQRFLVLTAKALMLYGSPLHYLEDNLSSLAVLLDLEVTVSAIPGLILLSFEDSVTHTSETKLIRCGNGWDMHRLDQTNQLLRQVINNGGGEGDGVNGDLQIAVSRLEEIMTAAPIYAWYWQVLNWGVISWTLCLVCFNGSWTDSGISLGLGLMAGCLNLAAQKLSGFANFFEVSVSILAGLLSAALTTTTKSGCFGATALSATVVLLPGLVMTTGVIELSSRHMIAGTVRVFYALLLAFLIAFGLLIGVQIFSQLAPHVTSTTITLDLGQCHNGLSQWSWFGTFPLGIISISVLVNIHWRHWVSVTVVAGISYGVFWLFKFHLGLDDLAPVVASFVLGLVANVWSRFSRHTPYMILLPGEMFLVPGSVGVRGFSSLLEGSGSGGSNGGQLAIQMITTCLSIMIGLFASSFVVYPRGGGGGGRGRQKAKRVILTV
ncbi:pheromone-regulated protein prm10 [Coemansia aciculifera]|uniref:Pheromone-regulated protein prm10 n=1 Tax=Coemansia aciculifera TaxID=417176 RepID=A0ACC1M8Q9_9FUNG|nr:pheromone-regulated protein prm10 [Coemansia aciculifera]